MSTDEPDIYDAVAELRERKQANVKVDTADFWTESELETARAIVKRCGIRDGLFKGPRILNAVESIAYAISVARKGLESQLARVEKERDDAREMVTMMTTEKQRAEQDATSQCVEKVREMRDRFQEAADSSSLPNDLTASRDATVANALTRLLGELESLPLEQVEQEKRC